MSILSKNGPLLPSSKAIDEATLICLRVYVMQNYQSMRVPATSMRAFGGKLKGQHVLKYGLAFARSKYQITLPRLLPVFSLCCVTLSLDPLHPSSLSSSPSVNSFSRPSYFSSSSSLYLMFSSRPFYSPSLKSSIITFQSLSSDPFTFFFSRLPSFSIHLHFNFVFLPFILT